jgi:hypothetical protein
MCIFWAASGYDRRGRFALTVETENTRKTDEIDGLRYDEAVVGDSEVGILTSKALRALTKASRACLLYDFDNAAVADFLRELDYRLERVFEHGPCRLEVRPWELLRDGEVVYREQDREKSLAFRLYYDGVRSLTIRPEVSWEEITRLVGILSIRYTFIRQQEEDVVTLLWKAGLQHIDFEAMEGYTPVDDELDEDQSSEARDRFRSEFYGKIHTHELPRPGLGQAVEVRYRPIPPDSLAALRAEDSEEALPGLCSRLVALVMQGATDANDPIEIDRCLPLIRDIRDYLLSEEASDRLLESVRAVHQCAAQLEDTSARTSLLAVFTEREAFARMVDAAIAAEQVPEALLEVMTVAPIDELEVLLQVLASRWTQQGETIARELLAAAVGGRLRQLRELMLGLSGPLAEAALDIAVDRDPEFATLLAVAMVRRQERSLRLKSIEALKWLPYRSEVGRVLIESALDTGGPEVCALAAEVLVAKSERRAFPAMARALKRGIDGGGRSSDLVALAQSLAQLDPAKTVSQLRDWIQPDKLLKRVRATPGPLWELAVQSLAAVRGQEAGELLRWIHSRADGELKMKCIQAMSRQRELK